MYWWELVGPDTTEGPLRSGVSENLAPIMRMIEEDLAKRTGFVGCVTEVVPRMSVLHLDAVHVATGREWIGRRDKGGGVCWEERYHPVDPDCGADDTGYKPSSVAGVIRVMGYPSS